MRLRKNQPRYKLPPFGQVLSVVIEGNQRHNQMCAIAIPIVPLQQVLGQEPGMPKCCAVTHGIIEFGPPPDKPYEVCVRYYPPIATY